MEYNSNISLEKLIVEQLIAGPPFEGAYPTIPSETKLLNISIKDNICYVNLDEGFLGTGYNVIESIPVYSIVNSLIENTDAQKVQISINGETNPDVPESINFDTILKERGADRTGETTTSSVRGVLLFLILLLMPAGVFTGLRG